MKKAYIYFGPPGGGKGTQVQRSVAKYNLYHIDTGKLLRQHIADETPLGLQAKPLVENGKYVPDDLVINMIDDCIYMTLNNDPHANFAFDGFPRTQAQAEALEKIFEKHAITLELVLNLEVTNIDILVQRLLKRGETSGRADDKNETIMRQRITTYVEKTMPILEYYGNKVVTIQGYHEGLDSFQSIELVAKEVETAFKTHKKELVEE